MELLRPWSPEKPFDCFYNGIPSVVACGTPIPGALQCSLPAAAGKIV